MSYSEIKSQLHGLPKSWYPGLLLHLVEECIEQKVFNAGRIGAFVHNIESASGGDALNQFKVLLRDYANAIFACGEHTFKDDEDLETSRAEYSILLEKAEKAKIAVLSAFAFSSSVEAAQSLGSLPENNKVRCDTGGESNSPGWAAETMSLINKLTPDIKGKAFDPDWFLLKERLERAEACFAPK